MKSNSEIKILESGNICTINFIGIIGLKEWQRDVPALQENLGKDGIKTVFVGFEQCKECIPIAIVTLFLAMARNKGKEFSVYVSSNEGEKNHKIFDLFLSMRIADLCKQWGISLYLDGKEWLDDRIYIHNYESSPLLIFDAMKYTSEEIVEKLFEMANWGQIDSYDADIKIKNILFETIANIGEHAYPSGEKPYAGVFVRRCRGVALDSKYECQSMVKQLYANKNKEYYQQLEHFYEIIVVDEGIGLTKSLGIRNSDGKRTKYPFSESFTRTFIHRERKSTSIPYKSYYSGLNLIFKLLNENADYVYGMEGEELIDVLCSGNSPVGKTLLQNEHKFKGVSWMFHVSIKRSSKLEDISESGPYNSVGKNEKILENCKKRDELSENMFKNYHIIDDRRTFRNIKNYFYSDNECDDNITVWFHDVIRTKNDLLNEVQKKAKDLGENEVLIIGDVEESELPSYYCALDRWGCPDDFNCKRIVVVSKHLRVQVYKKDDNNRIIQYSSEEARNYLSSDSSNPQISLIGYHKLVMKYDSSLLWSRIFQKKKKNYLVVRGDIEWERNPLSYYLNLEMILADRELYDIIKHNLNRVSGFTNRDGYYKSIDVVMKKMCIDMNFYKNELECRKNIYVESIYVTGRTDKIIEMQKDELKICIFVNYFDKLSENSNVGSLFVWPERSIIDKNIICWKQKLCRRAETHSLTSEERLSYLDFEKKQKNNERFKSNYEDTKNDMLHFYGDFVRLGHFNYHNNHDLFSLNQREIIKISAYQHNGVFLYALSLFMNTVGHGYYDSLREEWKEFLSRERFENGIFVYRMHYYTNYLFEMIDKCFLECNCDIWESVVPIESLERKSEQMPLLISDMVLFQLVDLIKEKVCSSKKCVITIFDTMNVSGKTMRDMERIVRYAEKIAKKDLKRNRMESEIIVEIHEEVLFDCETQHYDISAPGIPAYYHFDIPRLGTKENCILCSLIEKCNESKSLLNSEYAKKRIDSWIRAWKAVSPVFYKGIGGVEKSRIYDDSELCDDFSAYAMQLVEIAYSNSDRNYLYDYCKSENNLSAEQKMYLLSFQIILFSQKDNYKEYNNVYIELFKQLNAVNTTSNATALAAMIGVQANENTVRIAMAALIEEKNYLANEDIKIMIAILCGRYLSLKDCEYYKEIFDILKIHKKVDLDLLKGLHSQLYNVNGAMHSTRFERLIKPFGDAQLLNNHCDSVYYCLEYLQTTVEALNPLLIRADGKIVSFYPKQDREKDEVKNAIENGKEFLEKVKHDIALQPRNVLLPEEKVFLEQNVTKPFEEFHRKLFIPYGKKEGCYGKPILNEIMSIMREASLYSYTRMKNEDPRKRHEGVEEDNNRIFYYYDLNKDKELQFFLEDHKKPEQIGGKKEELWYLWNQYVAEELYYLFGDIRHSMGFIEHRTYKDKLSLFVNFVVEEDKIIITFNSMSDKSAQEIENLVTVKHRYQREAISVLGVSIEYSSDLKENKLYLLQTKVTIPAIC